MRLDSSGAGISTFQFSRIDGEKVWVCRAGASVQLPIDRFHFNAGWKRSFEGWKQIFWTASIIQPDIDHLSLAGDAQAAAGRPG
jgi:hypothetical protein